MELMLPARPPFSFASVVNSHGWVQLLPFARNDHDLSFNYVVRLGSGRVVDLQIAEASGGARVTVDFGPAGADTVGADTLEVDRIVTWMLGLHQDFSAFYGVAAAEPRLAHAAEQARGRVLRSATVFEDAIKTILTTNTTWSGTRRMVQALVSNYGDPLPGDTEPLRHAFPTPERLAALDEAALRAVGKLGFRAPSVLALARSVAAGTLDLEGLKTTTIPTLELRKHLLSIRGIGDYAAANLLMLLGRYDFVPVDSWALKMVSQEWHAGAPVGRPEVEAAFERWGEWKGLAYFFWEWSG